MYDMRTHPELVAGRVLDQLAGNVLDAVLVMVGDVGVALPVSIVRVGVQGTGRRVRHPGRRDESCIIHTRSIAKNYQ